MDAKREAYQVVSLLASTDDTECLSCDGNRHLKDVLQKRDSRAHFTCRKERTKTSELFQRKFMNPCYFTFCTLKSYTNIQTKGWN